MPGRLSKLAELIGRPTAYQRALEDAELAPLIERRNVSGALNAPGHTQPIERVRLVHRSRRVKQRLIASLVVIVAVTAFWSAFNANRFLHGVETAAIAAAAPVALYLGLRKD